MLFSAWFWCYHYFQIFWIILDISKFSSGTSIGEQRERAHGQNRVNEGICCGQGGTRARGGSTFMLAWKSRLVSYVLWLNQTPNERKSIFHCEKHVTAIIFYHHILPTRIFTFPLTLCNIFTIKTAIFAPHRNPICILIVFLCLNLQRVNRLVLISRSREAFSIYSIRSTVISPIKRHIPKIFKMVLINP